MQNLNDHIETLSKEIESILIKFPSIPLQEVSSESYMSRFDNKYLFSSILLPNILEKMHDQYNVLEIDEHRLLNYQSQYFDTNSYNMYLDHHNGKRDRYKIRYREYLESGHKFLEIKHKNNKGFTSKQRIPVHSLDIGNQLSTEFIERNSSFKTNQLFPTLKTTYNRIAFVNKSLEKRITIDCSLTFTIGHDTLFLPGLAIAEIKNLDRNPSSRFNRILDNYNIRKCSFSKYAIGVSLLNNQVKKNIFKEKLTKIQKLQDEFTTHFRSKLAQY